MGPQTDFLNNPQYQRALQIYSRFDPTRKALVDTVIADTQFASKEMRDKLTLLKMGMAEKQRERTYELAEEGFDIRKGLEERGLDIRERGLDIEYDYRDSLSDQESESDLLGWANIGISGLEGWSDLQRKKRRAEQMQSLQMFDLQVNTLKTIPSRWIPEPGYFQWVLREACLRRTKR